MDLVYPPVTAAARTFFRLIDLPLKLEGAEHVPRPGCDLLVSNHVSYLDFIFVGLAAGKRRRLVRFMAKEGVFDHRISRPADARHAPHPGRPGRRPPLRGP